MEELATFALVNHTIARKEKVKLPDGIVERKSKMF
jgi:hypothetical protein